jgi:hypothetical protein
MTNREPPLRPASDWIISPESDVPRPPFHFNSADDRFLDEVEMASFWYLWNKCDPKSGMVYDRSSVTFASVAGVGFQLAAIPAAVERGWIGQEEGRVRCEHILRALEANPANRKAGLFYHYVDGQTAAPLNSDGVSTIDSALFFAGAFVASEYFGGDVREIADRLIDGADWSFFVMHTPRENEPYLKGFIALGWKPAKFSDPTGDGRLSPYAWADAADEQRLVGLIAEASPSPSHRPEGDVYYRLRRMLGEYHGSGVHVWFPWSGALFTHFFAHCFIDYAHLPPDNPGAHGFPRAPHVDWWENSRRGARLNQIKCEENPLGLPTLAAGGWGLTASDAATGYAVPGVFPDFVATSDQVPQVDFAQFTPNDDYGDGTIAPYGAGCTIMFDPTAALAALRSYRALTDAQGEPLVWGDPGPHGETGKCGFRDAFNLAGKDWVAPDYVAIDQGPLVLAIENARSGLIWRLFQAHPAIRQAQTRLGLVPRIQP